MAASNCVPAVFDEFKRHTVPDWIQRLVSETIRVAYNAGISKRGRADQTVRIYQYLAPLVVAGENGFDEPALLDRFISVDMSKAKSQEHKAAFEALSALPIERLGRSLLDRALQVTDEELAGWIGDAEARTPLAYIDRPRWNLVVCQVGLRLLSVVLGKPIAVGELFDVQEGTARLSVVDRVLEMMSQLSEQISVYDGSKERLVPRWQGCDIKPWFDVRREGDLLYLSLPTAHSMWTKYAKSTDYDGDMLSKADVLKYVQQKPYFVSSGEEKRLGKIKKRWLVLSVSGMLKTGLDLSEEWAGESVVPEPGLDTAVPEPTMDFDIPF
jgi:hypothetical protein